MSILDRFRRKKQTPDTTRHVMIVPARPVTWSGPLLVPVDTGPAILSIPSFRDGDSPGGGCGASSGTERGGTGCDGF